MENDFQICVDEEGSDVSRDRVPDAKLYIDGEFIDAGRLPGRINDTIHGGGTHRPGHGEGDRGGDGRYPY
jgi:hypothetical protein